ncbi:hypothetical protein F3Y22_tig00004988pilonHSYRG00004 [Hibiscus syriacus]|uniref:RNase H type-1 domain-containing protein n=1 Tax=Hibiscus syriacus TaxID=106335 RepID=A0A6A3CKP1_HIBSY|nr:hypothetical protein F3Y22_tig00004988pilonHSYRG00004 [Hibiscus syriacus]
MLDFAWLLGDDFIAAQLSTDKRQFDRTNSLAVIGVIASDHHGLVVEGHARKMEGTFTEELVEATTFIGRIKMAIKNGWDKVDIEGDSYVVVNRLLSFKPDLSFVGFHLRQVRDLLQKRTKFKVLVVPQKANRVAHELARWAVVSGSSTWFVSYVPCYISNLVVHEAVGID